MLVVLSKIAGAIALSLAVATCAEAKFNISVHNAPRIAAREKIISGCAFGHHLNSASLEQGVPANFSKCIIRSAPIIWRWNDGSDHYDQVVAWGFLFNTAGSGNATRLGYLDSALAVLKSKNYKGIMLAGSTPPQWAVVGNNRETTVTAMTTGPTGTLRVTAPGNGFWTNSLIYFHGGTLPTTSPQIQPDTGYCVQGNNFTVAGDTLDIKTCGGTNITVSGSLSGTVKIGLTNSNPANWNDLKNYLNEVITRAKAAGVPVVAVEGINEWRNCGTIFYCGNGNDVLEYQRNLYKFTKELDPSIKVLMSPSNSMNNDFFKEMIDAVGPGEGFGFDAVATHGYTFPNSTSYNSNTHIAKPLDDFITYLQKSGFGGMPAYNTELGAEYDPGASTVTIDAATDTVTWNAHNKPNGTPVVFSTTGVLPTGILPGNVYYTANATTNTIQLTTAVGGAVIDLAGTQSGAHSVKTSITVYNARQVAQSVLLTMARSGTQKWAGIMGYAWGGFDLMGHYGMCAGTCSIGSGVPNEYGTAWGVVEGWLKGAKRFSYSQTTANITEIEFTQANGFRARTVWTADQAIQTYTVPGWAHNYKDLAGNTTGIGGGTVTISFAPILLVP
jgi:hypothetical protein